jgi:hypothetical protein
MVISCPPVILRFACKAIIPASLKDLFSKAVNRCIKISQLLALVRKCQKGVARLPKTGCHIAMIALQLRYKRIFASAGKNAGG